MSYQDLFLQYYPSMLRGLWTTLLLSAVTLLIATPLALVIALARENCGRMISIPLAILVNTVRLLPALLVLFFIFYASPQFGYRLQPLTAAMIGLSIMGAAYMSEDFRGSIAAIDPGQYKAAKALGLSHLHTLRRIILPQAVPLAIPPYITRAIIMVKATSLASMVAVSDLTASASRATSITYEPFLFIMLAGIGYLLISGLLALLQAWAEAKIARAYRLALR
ncbi:Polar amino acid transport system permease protein [Hyphomicrobiales bacterium]|jgi:His/Glu/Gln/Arg/opine family amino acid ABC transporter permease subunit|nr:Polar amino acid transport system permease protein [Hyphomicrobiales bacterium]CAH1692742.1 Polar amino acid transport system permease protein [Hyphomicrobiales bacterium]